MKVLIEAFCVYGSYKAKLNRAGGEVHLESKGVRIAIPSICIQLSKSPLKSRRYSATITGVRSTDCKEIPGISIFEFSSKAKRKENRTAVTVRKGDVGMCIRRERREGGQGRKKVTMKKGP